MRQLPPQPEPIQLLTRVLQGALAVWQVRDADAVGMGKEGAGHRVTRTVNASPGLPPMRGRPFLSSGLGGVQRDV